MSARLYRAQILLEPQQHEALRTLALQEGRSISDTAREVIAIGLTQLGQARGRQLAALARLTSLRSEMAERSGPLTVPAAEILSEIRAERELQLDHVLEERTA